MKYNVYFSDNWDSYDDDKYLLAEDFQSKEEAEQYITCCKKFDKVNGEENRWTYHIIPAWED